MELIKNSLAAQCLVALWLWLKAQAADSAICRGVARAWRWFGRQWNASVIVTRFSSQTAGRGWALGRGLHRLYVWAQGLLHRAYLALHLDKLLARSVFLMPALWCGAAMVLAPFLPTMLVLALVLVAFGSLFLTICRDKDRTLVQVPVNKFIYLYGLVYLYATVTSVDFSGSLFIGLISVVFLLFFLVFLNSVSSWDVLKRIVIGAAASGVLVSLYGFYQYVNKDAYSGAWVDSDMFDIAFRAYSTLGNPNVLGTYFLLVIPFAVALLFTAKSLRGRLLWLCAAGVMLLCLVITYSRGCYLGILFAAALFLVLLDRRFLILGLVGLCLLPFVLPETIITRFTSIGNMGDTSTSYRVYIWMGVLAMLKDYWFSGIGPGTGAFNLVYPAYSYHSISAPHSHNLFLQIICDGGICAILLFFLIGWSFYRTMFTAIRKAPWEKRVFLSAGIASVSGFVVESMTDYTFYNYRVMLMFWGFLAISVLFAKLSPATEQEELS